VKKASDLVSAMMDAFIQNEQQREAVSLFSAWAKIAGINEGSHSKIEEIEGGIVWVKVDHPGWLQKLEMKRAIILKKLQKNYPELSIRTIRFRL
jgi:predicted nucleic acid-binding Zn ribbon protein